MKQISFALMLGLTIFAETSFGVGQKETTQAPHTAAFVIPKAVPRVVDATWKGFDEHPIEQMNNDATLLYHTLFITPENLQKYIQSHQFQDMNKRQDFLKRLILLVVQQELQFTPERNGTDLKPWPYNVASPFGHGQRILIQVNRKGRSSSLYNLLLAGNSSVEPQIDISRAAASHGMELNRETRYFNELKLSNAPDTAKNLKFGFMKKHRGVNIPLGGIGNIGPSGNIVGPEGTRIDQDGLSIKGIQHGHVYIFKDSEKDKSFRKAINIGTSGSSALLIGIENAAPGMTNATGHKHTAGGAFLDPNRKPSVTGGKKWTPLVGKDNAPAALGGMRVIINGENEFRRLKEIFKSILNLPEHEQRKLFKQMLFSTIPKAKQALDLVLRTIGKGPGNMSDYSSGTKALSPPPKKGLSTMKAKAKEKTSKLRSKFQRSIR